MNKFKKILYNFYGDFWLIISLATFIWFWNAPARIFVNLNFSIPHLFIALSAVLIIVSLIINLKNKKLGICEIYTISVIVFSIAIWIRYVFLYGQEIMHPEIKLFIIIPNILISILFPLRVIYYIKNHLTKNALTVPTIQKRPNKFNKN